MKPSEQLRELVAWYSKTNCNDVQRTSILLRGVELIIPAVEQLEQAQRERDEVIRTLAKSVIDAESRTDGFAPPRWVVIEMHAILRKLGGAV